VPFESPVWVYPKENTLCAIFIFRVHSAPSSFFTCPCCAGRLCNWTTENYGKLRGERRGAVLAWLRRSGAAAGQPDMADNINYVVTAVIRGCQDKNVETTEVMAAFVARARVLEAPELYHPNASLKEDDVNELVKVRRGRSAAPILLHALQPAVASPRARARRSPRGVQATDPHLCCCVCVC
jgi:hypothetical protein